MDVFKTHVGEGKALMINEENFYLATRERKPYVVDSGGVKSFYAIGCQRRGKTVRFRSCRSHGSGMVQPHIEHA